MSNCPLCGSPGDDLVFKFYCSNGKCVNFVSSVKDPFSEFKVDPVVYKKLALEGEVFSVEKPEYVGEFPKRKTLEIAKDTTNCLGLDEYVKIIEQHIYAGLMVPKKYWSQPEPYASEYSCRWLSVTPSFPEFTLLQMPFSNVELMWQDKVPHMLNELVIPILRRYLGTELPQMHTYELVREYLLNMVQRGELTWNNMCNRWELHFTE